MEPIEVTVVIGAVCAPVFGAIAAFRWRRSLRSRPAGWRFWMTLVSLLFSLLVAAEFAAMLVRASFVDFNAHYEEDLFWIRVMLGTSLGSVLAALCGKGAGRLWSLVTGCMILAFVMLVGSIPP